MITSLLRRLQGRPAPSASVTGTDAPVAAEHARGEGTPEPTGHAIDPVSLEHHFIAWAFDLPDGEPRPAQAIEAAFGQMELIAQRFDVRRMPRLPALLPQLLAAMRRDDSDVAELANLLSRDPTLVGETLRVAGSAFYRRTNPPAGLPQAVHALGHEGLRHVVLGSVMRPILRGDPRQAGMGTAARLWAHSGATTWLCGRIAAGRCDAGEAQLAGIVAGTGLAALSRMVPPSLLDDAAGDPDFAARLVRIARPLSWRAAQHWHLPANVLEALQHIGNPDAHESPLAEVLRAAERLSMGFRLVEAGWLPPDATWPSGIAECDERAAREALRSAMADELVALDAETARF